MREAATAVERIINEDMAWLTKVDAQKLLISLLDDAPLRKRLPPDAHQSREHRVLRRSFKTFNQTLGAIIAAEIMKEGLSQQVKTYADTFAEWIESTNTVRADVTSLDHRAAQPDAGDRRHHCLGPVQCRDRRRPRSPSRSRAPRASSSWWAAPPC